MSDLGEEFAKICIQWLKKALVCVLTAFRPSFPHLETFKTRMIRLRAVDWYASDISR